MSGLPVYDAVVFKTKNMTPYLKEPGVAMIMAPQVCAENFEPFLNGFDSDLKYGDYIKDPTTPQPADHLCKLAGQLCYLSFGPDRTWNADVQKYLTNIRSSGHGSVLEHPSFSFLCWGISRSLTHELVRHRAGVAYSQVSQRYVSGKSLRFVERPEYQNDPELHAMFEQRIDTAAAEYNNIASILVSRQSAGNQTLSGESRRDLRKKVNQCARSCLPNETEAPLVFTSNARALRHIFEMRVSSPAEIEIRKLGYRIYKCVQLVAPTIFDDYEIEELADGTLGLKTPYRKV